MEVFLHGASTVFLALGCFLLVSGALGLLRFPDFYTRIHATGVSETMGAGFILLGLMCLSPSLLVFFKLMFILLFLLITGPTSGHTMAKAAQHGGLKPYAPQLTERALPAEGQHDD